ncbi:MAG TPA: VWA domain-containing protein [Gammaproteobacteria bacterium]
MNRWIGLLDRTVTGFLAASVIATLASAQPPEDKEQQALEEITVTGMHVTVGGARDVKFARGEIVDRRIPHPDAITAEGLLGEHDLTLPSAGECRQLLCLLGEATAAHLPTLPHAKYLVELGFASNIDETTWRRAPLNLIAVIDKSGSMSGEPLALVKRSLRGLIGNLEQGDQLSIVLYGDRSHVHLQPTRVSAATVPTLLSAVDAIESAGSTNMESGLRVGYDVARRTKADYDGITRVALFTDERPNVGHTDEGSFIAMARAASADGIGLTTIGVGVQFDSGLATELSSTRGGNLFFLDGPASADALFTDELDYLVSELAHDLRVTLVPADGFKIAGVYGVPGEVLGWHDATSVTITVPTLFLSRKGGGLFVSVAPADAPADLPQRPLAAGAPLLAVSHSYVPVGGKAKSESGSLTVGAPGGAPSESLALGHALVDEYLSLRAATTAHHVKNDQDEAYAIVRDLYRRLSVAQPRSLRRGLAGERDSVAGLLDQVAFLSGHGSEITRESSLWGHWRVAALDGEFDGCHWGVGDVLLFSATNELVSFVAQSGAGYAEDERHPYLSTRREIYLPDEDATAAYRLHDDELVLRFGDDAGVRLVRAEAPATH